MLKSLARAPLSIFVVCRRCVPIAWLPLMALMLSACGGGGEDFDQPGRSSLQAVSAEGQPAPLAFATRLELESQGSSGTLVSASALATVSQFEIAQAMIGRRVPAIVPIYEVDTYRLGYMTIDGNGQPILASGLVAVPKKGAGALSPAISYQHATTFSDAEAPSNNATGSEPSVVLASLGYVTVAADYVGYGVSNGVPHPYLVSAPTAAAVVDMLTAANTFVQQQGIAINGQLFMLGYSEGGYATAAAHRLLQAKGDAFHAALIGSSAGGAPLDVGATLDVLLQRVRDQNSFLAFFVNPDLLQNLGSWLRRQVRDALLKQLLPGDADVVFQTNFIDNFLANDREAIRRDSDVHDWRPDKAMRLFHGLGDQTVPYQASEHAWQSMLDRGAPDVMLQTCATVPDGHLQCVPEYWQFVLGQLASVARDL